MALPPDVRRPVPAGGGGGPRLRTAFIGELETIAEQDTRVMLLTGDLGFMVVEDFARKFPERFVNVGVAEANMLAMAAGLAQQGLIPFCYSIATFASMRGYEQLRNGAVLHGSKVRVVGIGGGFAYGSAGATHHALEDLGLARLQPGLAVVAPADDRQAVAALKATYDQPGPIYYRVGKDSCSVPELEGRFRAGRLELIGDGADLAVVTTGSMTAPVGEAVRLLAKEGIAATVAVAACISPAPVADLEALVAHFPRVVTVEDHYRDGGLGSLVAEVIAEAGTGTRLLRIGVEGGFDGVTGSEAYLRRAAGLDPESLAGAIASTRPGSESHPSTTRSPTARAYAR